MGSGVESGGILNFGSRGRWVYMFRPAYLLEKCLLYQFVRKKNWVPQTSIILETFLYKVSSSSFLFAYVLHFIGVKIYFFYIPLCLFFPFLLPHTSFVSLCHSLTSALLFPAANYDLRCCCYNYIRPTCWSCVHVPQKNVLYVAYYIQAAKHGITQSPFMLLLVHRRYLLAQ